MSMGENIDEKQELPNGAARLLAGGTFHVTE